MAKALTKDQKAEVSASKSRSTKNNRMKTAKGLGWGAILSVVAVNVAAKTTANKPISAKARMPMNFVAGFVGVPLLVWGAFKGKTAAIAVGMPLAVVGISELYLQQYLNRMKLGGQTGWRGGFNPNTEDVPIPE